MTERTLAVILEEVTASEISDGIDSPRAKRLREEARNHPSAAAGRDLPPIIGYMGVKPSGL
jgi:hypothetical protein